MSPTEDTPNLCLQLFSDWHSRSQLGPTDRGRLLGKDQETDGASKAGRSKSNSDTEDRTLYTYSTDMTYQKDALQPYRHVRTQAVL